MGDYEKSGETHDGRPVWKMKVGFSLLYPVPFGGYTSYFYYNGKILR